MKAREKYFSRLQWLKTKNSYGIFELQFPWYCSYISKDPLAPEFVLFCLQKVNNLLQICFISHVYMNPN